MWQLIDPLPVLTRLQQGDGADDESLESLVEGDGSQVPEQAEPEIEPSDADANVNKFNNDKT